MEEILTRPVDVDDKLQKEIDKLSSLKDALGRSNQLTENMLTIVTSFENRLSKLEETITPVYQETGNLQRRHENIEKTLGALDHVIEYYHVAEEVEPAIREGPGAGLESYIGSMQRLQKAVQFFNKNNPDSPEMSQATTLYEAGKDTLEREFKNTLSRHSKPVPAVLLLDILAIDDELPNEQPQQIEHLPNKVKTDLINIANWLLNCGEKTDYMQAYSQVRSGILLKSMQTLKDHLKTGSKDSASFNQMLHSPALIGKSKPGRDTPSKRAMKRMAFVRKASTALMKQSIAQLEAAGLKRPSTSGSDLRSAEDSVEVDIDFYITGVSALLKLMKSEITLMEGIIPVKFQHKVFDHLIQAALESVKKEGEQISSNIRRAIGRGQQHTPVLAIFPVLRHLRAIRQEFTVVLEGCSPTTKSRLTNLISTLDSTGAKALEEFVDSVRNDPNKQTNMPTDGTVHELTSNTIVFLEQLLEFEETAGAMLLTQALIDKGYKKIDPAAVELTENSQRKLAEYITKVLSSLGLNLNNKCETYNDVTLKSIFMLNNYNYILKSLKRTGMLDVVRHSQPQVEEFYDEQIMEQKRLYSQRTRMLDLVHGIDGDIETHYNSQIEQQKKQYRQSWSKVLHYIMEASNPISHNRLSSPETKLKDKDRQAIKDKFSGFNKEMEEIHRIQKAYAIPDSQLRDSLKNDNKEFIVPQYQMFREKYKNVNFTKNPEKYIKYTVADIGRFIDKFFDAAA